MKTNALYFPFINRDDTKINVKFYKNCENTVKF